MIEKTKKLNQHRLVLSLLWGRTSGNASIDLCASIIFNFLNQHDYKTIYINIYINTTNLLRTLHIRISYMLELLVTNIIMCVCVCVFAGVDSDRYSSHFASSVSHSMLHSLCGCKHSRRILLKWSLFSWNAEFLASIVGGCGGYSAWADLER